MVQSQMSQLHKAAKIEDITAQIERSVEVDADGVNRRQVTFANSGTPSACTSSEQCDVRTRITTPTA